MDQLTFEDLLDMLMEAQYNFACAHDQTIESWKERLYERDKRYKAVVDAFRAIQQPITENVGIGPSFWGKPIN